MKLSEILPHLIAKFPPEAHKERTLPGSGKWWYVPWQTIRARLNEVCPDDWEVSYDEPQYLDKYCHVTCTLMICGVTRRAIGSAPIELISSNGKDMSRGNPIERAVADAFKNACESFGIAAYLDDQTDDRTKRDFVRYMQQSGNGKVAVEYRRQQTGQTEPAPRPNQSKPFGQQAIDPNAPKLITEPQQKRFWGIAKKAGFTNDGVKRLLYAEGLESTASIPAVLYNTLCERAGNPEIAAVYNEEPAVSIAQQPEATTASA